MNTKHKYIRIDCDNVGDKIELCLYQLNPDKAQNINKLIKNNISDLAASLNTVFNSEILLVGPDDILLRMEKDKYDIILLNKLRENFFKKTEITLSIGVGDDIISAMRNLDIAKKLGKNQIYE